MLGCYYSVFKEDRDGTLEHYSPERSFFFHGVLILLSMDSDHFLEEQRESIKLNIKEHIVIKNKYHPLPCQNYALIYHEIEKKCHL